MINLKGLRPSEWDQLEFDLATGKRHDEFLHGLLDFLLNAVLDGGACTDEIYVLAIETENIGAWKHIEPHRLLTVLRQVDPAVAKVFLSGVSPQMDAALTLALDSLTELPRPVAPDVPVGDRSRFPDLRVRLPVNFGRLADLFEGAPHWPGEPVEVALKRHELVLERLISVRGYYDWLAASKSIKASLSGKAITQRPNVAPSRAFDEGFAEAVKKKRSDWRSHRHNPRVRAQKP